jgi:hypothetical protein
MGEKGKIKGKMGKINAKCDAKRKAKVTPEEKYCCIEGDLVSRWGGGGEDKIFR